MTTPQMMLSGETLQNFNFDFDRYYYLSGPMAGYPEHNFPAFRKAAAELRESGILVLSPHEVDHPGLTGQPEEWAQYLANDLKVMIEATQGIILLTGWPQSKGARLELNTSLALERPVYFYNSFTLTDMNKLVEEH